METGLTWLVDGYNVLQVCLLAGEERSRWWKAEGRDRVLALAERFCDPEAEIWVVFDGANESQERRAGVHIAFAPSADDWIIRRVRRAEAPERIAVVTGDRQLADRAAHRGARVVRPRDFAELCDRNRGES